MALGTLGDIVTFTVPAGSPLSGTQTGVVIGVVPTVSNTVGYCLGVKADGIKWAHQATVASVTVLSNQTKH